jgi:hypothetical protein
MGYMGLDSWVDSDLAAGFVGTVMEKGISLKKLRKEMKEENGEFNTDGIVNVGLFLEVFNPNIAGLMAYLELDDFIRNEFIPSMEEYIERNRTADWGDISNKRSHLTAYRRLLRHAEKLII